MKTEIQKIDLETLNSVIQFKGKDKVIAENLIETYQGVGGDNKMLETGILVWKKMYEKIHHLKAADQWEIIHTTTMLVYDARIAAFDHITNFEPDLPDRL